jgi:hypothetical protein
MSNSKRYRLSYGELATPSIVRQRLLLALLSTAERLYPAMREELIEKALQYSSDGICDFYHLPQELQRYCVEYCQKFGLINPEKPEPIFARIADYLEVPAKPPVPYYALDCIATTLSRTACMRRWSGFHLASGAALIEHETGFEPHKMTLSDAKRRWPRSKWPELRAAVDAAVEAGSQPVRTRTNPAIIEWCVRAQFGGESWRQVAMRILGPATPKHLVDGEADAIRKQARELLYIVGLSRTRGRRRK